MPRRTDLLLVAVMTLGTHLLYQYCSNGNYFFPDSATYTVPAQHLLQGHGFTDRTGAVETIRTPLYPLALVPLLLAHTPVETIAFLQHCANAGVAVAIFALASRLWGRKAAWLAAIIFAFDVPTIHIANKILTESFFTAALFVLVVLLLRLMERGGSTAQFIAAGLLAGALVLIRPVAIVYFVVAAILLYRSAAKPAALVLFVIAALLLPACWCGRNLARADVFTISSVAGINTLQYRAAGALAVLDDDVWQRALADHQQELRDAADDEIQLALHIPDAEELPTATRAKWYGRIGRRIALKHPVGFALVTFRGLLVNLFDTDWDALEIVSELHPSILALTVTAWTHAVVFAAIAGLVLLWRTNRTVALLIGATIVYFVGISAGAEAEYRFRVPVVPMLALAAGSLLGDRRDALPSNLAVSPDA